MTASEQIDKVISDHPDWRGRLVAEVRRLVREADPEMLEVSIWKEVPSWSHEGLVCVATIFKDTVKFVFASGAKLPDPNRMFNSELTENERRGIKFTEKDTINEPAFKKLVRSAVDFNISKKDTKPQSKSKPTAKGARRK